MEIPQTIASDGEKARISVYLSNKNGSDIKYFHCPICGHKLFGYYSDTKIILAGKGEFSKSPIQVQCNGAITVEKNGQTITTRCKSLYFIS